MKNINYLSDLKIIEKYPQNVASFVYHFTTDCSNKCYDVSLELGNCFKLVKDGEELLVITLDSHGLKEGQLKVRRELNYVDDDFPDKEYNKVTENLYDIYLVDGKSDEVEDIEVEGYIPVFRGYSAYEIAVQQGFEGTEEEWLESLKGKYKFIEEWEEGNSLGINADYVSLGSGSDMSGIYMFGTMAATTINGNNFEFNDTYFTVSNGEGRNKKLLTWRDGKLTTGLNNAYTFLTDYDADKRYLKDGNLKTINGENLVGFGNINVALYDQIPQVQTSYSDAVNHYINSDGYTDSNKCALSSKNTTILQGTKGTWSEGKLLFRKGRWGDDGYSTIAIPTATTEFDGLLSKEDKVKVDKIDTVEETANNAAANASFATSKISELYNELGNKQDTLVSGENIKTINGESILGSGDVTISGGDCNVFIATYGTTTYNEVLEAHNNGKKVLVNNLPNNVSNLEIQTVQSNYIIFKGIQGYNQGGLVMIYLYAADNNWVIAAYTYFQEKSAKLETITSAATNEQYPSAKAVYDFVKPIEDKVDNLELFKFPNATIFGQPTIQQGQISNFTAENYLQFPFIVDFQNRPWQIDMAVTMGADVSGQHNILDSNFGLAFAIQNTKLVLALSYDGVAWAGAYTSGTSIEPNKTYYIKISWDGAIYKVDVSEDKTTYTNFISVNSTNTLYPRTITIGKSIDNRYIWNGSINFNEAKLTISDKVVWTGMDDAGLSTRLAVNLNNIDAEGVEKIKDITTKNGVLSQSYNNYVPYDIIRGNIPISLITEAAFEGIIFNEITGYFEYEGITNITAQEVSQFVRRGTIYCGAGAPLQYMSTTTRIGRYILNSAGYINGTSVFAMTDNEYAIIQSNQRFTNCNSMFRFSNVRVILGILYITGVTATNLTNMFDRCPNLQTVSLQGLSSNIVFTSSPNITNESILYMIEKAANTSAITITFHSSTYDRVINDESIVTAAQNKNITLASA